MIVKYIFDAQFCRQSYPSRNNKNNNNKNLEGTKAAPKMSEVLFIVVVRVCVVSINIKRTK